MIRPFPRPNLIEISILLSLLLFGFGFGFASSRPVKITMKVHPVAMKRNITTRDAIDPRPSFEAQPLMEGIVPKKLRRLPHVFSKVLELPFSSDADVAVEELSDCFRFVAETEDPVADRNLRAQAVEIHPGVIKIVVRNGGAGDDGDHSEVELLLDELEVDAWRYRLPASARPEMATALFVDGELIVTVPKVGGELGGRGDVWGGVGRLIVVQ